jgi:hypothetical protein
MADMTIKYTSLEDLKRRASELVSAVQTLAILFEEGATRLSREDQVARLKILHAAILQKVERARAQETAANTGHSMASTVSSLFRFGGGLITMTSEDTTMQTISQQLLARSARKEPSFGTILIDVGSGGVPEDVEVINISRLTRESKRDECDFTGRLLADGHLLFTANAFSSLIDRLADEILKGGLSLPVPAERIRKIQKTPLLLLSSKNES